MASATATSAEQVFAEQWEIGAFMIEGVCVKGHDAASAAFVLGVALHTVVGIF